LLAAASRQLESLELPAAAAHAAAAAAGGQQCVQQQQQQQQRQPELMLDLSMLMYSLAKLSYRPTEQFLGLLSAAVADRAWRVVDCHDHLAALGGAWQLLQQPQQQQDRSAAIASQQQHILHQRQQLLQELHSNMRGRETSLLLWAMCRLRYQAPAALLRPLKMACSRQVAQFNAADVGVLWLALARMRHRPGYGFVRFMIQHFLARIDDRVGGAADVANIVHALPHLGGINQHYHLRQKVGEELLQGLADAAAARFSECGPKELVQLAQGFAYLGFSPGNAWVQWHKQRTQEVGKRQFGRREWRALLRAYTLLGADERALPQQAGVRVTQQQQQQQQQLSARQQRLLRAGRSM
jgi:hypothetical protein